MRGGVAHWRSMEVWYAERWSGWLPAGVKLLRRRKKDLANLCECPRPHVSQDSPSKEIAIYVALPNVSRIKR